MADAIPDLSAMRHGRLKQVLIYLLMGYCQKEITQRLRIHSGTVSVYCARLCRAFGARHITHLVSLFVPEAAYRHKGMHGRPRMRPSINPLAARQPRLYLPKPRTTTLPPT